jgi:hypothetical protein
VTDGHHVTKVAEQENARIHPGEACEIDIYGTNFPNAGK